MRHIRPPAQDGCFLHQSGLGKNNDLRLCLWHSGFYPLLDHGVVIKGTHGRSVENYRYSVLFVERHAKPGGLTLAVDCSGGALTNHILGYQPQQCLLPIEAHHSSSLQQVGHLWRHFTLIRAVAAVTVVNWSGQLVRSIDQVNWSGQLSVSQRYMPMTHPHPQIALLGECMLELSPASGATDQYRVGVAGDTYNTAVGLAQLGLTTEYVTAVGSDTQSQKILSHAARHGVGSQYIHIDSTAQSGLYLIDNDPAGERYFTYWRKYSAAHKLLSHPQQLSRTLDLLSAIPFLYISGITLALCSEQSRNSLFKWCLNYRQNGGKLIYDSNYRAALWPETHTAQKAHQQALELTDIFLPSAEDILILSTPGSKLVQTYSECVLKNSRSEIEIFHGGLKSSFTPEPVARVLDTSGAGDAFNAGYLAARLQGLQPEPATKFAADVAALTIQHQGAILPAASWSALKNTLLELAAHTLCSDLPVLNAVD